MDEAALRGIELFDGLSRKQRKLLALRADEVDVEPGTVLCSKGKTPHEFFVIEQGTARVVRDGQFLNELGPGDFFGEMGLLEDAPRNADVVAETPLTLMVLSGPAFKELEREAPKLARRLSRSVEQRRHWLEPVS
ncbi:MAG TPA: cyclic nucleotide-binding domain-containing protein [Thermoleophilaceae bacterium]|nr:cyclic nucleotide-binding domain-containing protein [Thermoleophilaceae bacterium]